MMIEDLKTTENDCDTEFIDKGGVTELIVLDWNYGN